MTGSGQLRVLICDDAVAFPRLVEVWLGDGNGITPCGVVTSAPELLERVGVAAPDVVLLDLMLPDGPASTDLVEQVRERAPGVRIVLASNLPQDALKERARELGADGWCSKATTAEGLIEALRAA